jgi:maltose alpha-D-glucosyltransferase / alpha-amylase
LYSSLIANTVYGYQAVNVESQRRFGHSLLCWMKSLIDVRNSVRVFSRGSIEFLCPSNHRILAYVRQLGEKKVLVVNNLSKSAQAVELDMHRYKDYIPIEMSSGNRFPGFEKRPYLLTLGSYQFYWFRLHRI